MIRQESPMEIGISRHAPKPQQEVGAVQDNMSQGIDKEQVAETIGPTVDEFITRLEQARAGSIMALEPSNVGRAEQTRGLLAEKLAEKLQERDDIKVVSLGTNEHEAELVLKEILANPGKKFILADVRGTWLLGSKEDEPMIAAANKWDKRLGDEHLRGALWASHKEELPKLLEKLHEAGIDITLEELQPGDFKHTPEEAAMRQIKWMLAMQKIAHKYFPDRPILLEGISHHIRSDFASLALLGEDISLEAVERVLGSKFREPFARSSVSFAEDGSVKVNDRGISKEYTPEEFKELLVDIRERDNIRKKEWGLTTEGNEDER